MNRRTVMATGGILLAGSLLEAKAAKKEPKLQRAYGGNNKILPLPFDPKSLRGISAKVITSHHAKNYSGAVKKLNLIQKQIASMEDSAHPIRYGALKKEELIALNSKLLHELYFYNLGGKGKMTAVMHKALIEAFGSIEQWKFDFVKTAKSLSGGSGWVILSYIKEQNILMHQIASDHTDSIATGTPLLVLDMYEHSYHMDYGPKAAAYIDAFMENINWDIVGKRLLEA